MFSRLFGVLCTALQFGFALLSRHGASLDCLKVNARGTLKGTRTDARMVMELRERAASD